jgi:hypothetical protein
MIILFKKALNMYFFLQLLQYSCIFYIYIPPLRLVYPKKLCIFMLFKHFFKYFSIRSVKVYYFVLCYTIPTVIKRYFLLEQFYILEQFEQSEEFFLDLYIMKSKPLKPPSSFIFIWENKSVLFQTKYSIILSYKSTSYHC